jgi:hypothetical protein
VANILTLTITDVLLDRKSAEAAYIERALIEVAKEIGRGNGTVTTGTILAYTNGLGPTAMGSWTYVPSAPNP